MVVNISTCYILMAFICFTDNVDCTHISNECREKSICTNCDKSFRCDCISGFLFDQTIYSGKLNQMLTVAT